MPHTAHRQTNLIIGKSLIMAETVMQELRERLVAELGERLWTVSQDELLRHARDILFTFEPLIAKDLQFSDLAAWIAGYDQVARQLPHWSLDLFRRSGGPPRPPRIAIPGLFGGDEPEPELRFPLLDKAMQSLLDREILTRPQFDELSAEARARAFTIAGDMAEDAIATIRDVLADDVREGTSLRGFRERLGEQLRGSFLGPGHLETVYRTNTQAAFRDGRESLASHPIVAELFPYQEYLPIGDTRVRPEHEAMGELGIDGTGVYRRDDDAVWNLFTPPWDFNCRCGVNLLTADKAASKGVKEAKRWAETGQKPPLDSRLPRITFRPPEGFGYRGRATITRFAQGMLFETSKQRSLFEQPKPAPKKDTNPWQPYTGPRGGRGWRHSGTGTIAYQADRPGEAQQEVEHQILADARRKQALERHRRRAKQTTESDERRAFLAAELSTKYGDEHAALAADAAHGYNVSAAEIARELRRFGIPDDEAKGLANSANQAIKAWSEGREGVKPIGDAIGEVQATNEEYWKKVREEEQAAQKVVTEKAKEWAAEHVKDKVQGHTVTREQWGALYWMRKRDESTKLLEKCKKIQEDLDSEDRDVWMPADDLMHSSYWKGVFKKYKPGWAGEKDKGSLRLATMVLEDITQEATERIESGRFEAWSGQDPYKEHAGLISAAIDAGKLAEIPDEAIAPYQYESWIPAEVRQSRHVKEVLAEYRKHRDGDEQKFHIEHLKRAMKRAEKHIDDMLVRAHGTIPPSHGYKRPDDWDAREEAAVKARVRLGDIAKESGGVYLQLTREQIKPELLEEYDRLTAERCEHSRLISSEHRKERDAERRAQHAWLSAVIGDHGKGKVAISGGEFLNDDGRESLDDAVAFLQTIASPEIGTIPLHIQKSTSTDNRESGGDNQVNAFPSTQAWVFVHEAGHVIDSLGANEVGNLSKAYAIERLRQSGVEPEHPGAPYDPHELMHRDELRNQYCGKYYPGTASEILSMGLQYLYEEPHKFFTEDERHFRYTLAAIRGLLT